MADDYKEQSAFLFNDAGNCYRDHGGNHSFICGTKRPGTDFGSSEEHRFESHRRLPGKSDPNGPPSSSFGVVITTLKYEDGEAVLNGNYPHVESLAMYVSGSDIISLNDNKVSATYYGTTASYPDVQNSSVENGRFFNKEEELTNAKVVVLGNKVAKDLFGDQDPFGEKLKIKKTNFTVIGVLKAKGGSLIQSEDSNLFVPIKTAQNVLLGINYIDFMRIKVDKTENINSTIDYVTTVLRNRHNIASPRMMISPSGLPPRP